MQRPREIIIEITPLNVNMRKIANSLIKHYEDLPLQRKLLIEKVYVCDSSIYH